MWQEYAVKMEKSMIGHKSQYQEEGFVPQSAEKKGFELAYNVEPYATESCKIT